MTVPKHSLDAFAASANARTPEEHIDAAHQLLGLMSEPKGWVGTPVAATLAGVHAQLAAVTARLQ